MKRLLLVLLLLSVGITLGQEKKVYKRGRLLRTEIRDVQAITSVSFRLLPNRGSFLTFAFQKQEQKTIQEVNVYQVCLEVVKPNEGQGVTAKGTVEYVPVPGKTEDGEVFVRRIQEPGVPLKNSSILLNGKEIRTDGRGLWVDSSQEILGLFDHPRTKKQIVTVVFQNQEPVKQLLYCYFLPPVGGVKLQAYEGRAAENVLEALRLDFAQRFPNDVSGLQAEVKVEHRGRPGQFIPVTVIVRNKGTKKISNLLGCSFAADACLTGKLFYFGAVAPGEEISFTRLLKMPERTGIVNLNVSFWSLQGAHPDKSLYTKLLLKK